MKLEPFATWFLPSNSSIIYYEYDEDLNDFILTWDNYRHARSTSSRAGHRWASVPGAPEGIGKAGRRTIRMAGASCGLLQYKLISARDSH